MIDEEEKEGKQLDDSKGSRKDSSEAPNSHKNSNSNSNSNSSSAEADSDGKIKKD